MSAGIETPEQKKSAVGSADAQRFLAFSLGGEEYALPLLSVKEVIAYPDVTPVPFTPPYFLGIMNLRGQVISVIDLRLKFNIKADKTEETAVIICDLGTNSFGVVVNSVNSVMSLSGSDIKPRPEIQSSKSSDYILGVSERDKKMVLLIDIASALDVADKNAISKIGEQHKKAA